MRVGPAERSAAGRDEPVADLHVLGPLRVCRLDGTWTRPAEYRTTQTRQLLRLLALHHPGGLPASTLVDMLWPSVPESRGRASLRTAASQLRTTLRGKHVVREGDTLHLEVVDIDLTRFEHHARLATLALDVGDPATALSAAQVALTAYAGDLAEDEPYLEPILEAQRRLASEQRELLLVTAQAALLLDRREEARRAAEEAHRRDRCCERAARLLIRSYDGLGERSMALQVYEQLRRDLGHEYGVAPSAPTQALYLQLLDDVGLDAPKLEPR